MPDDFFFVVNDAVDTSFTSDFPSHQLGFYSGAEIFFNDKPIQPNLFWLKPEGDHYRLVINKDAVRLTFENETESSVEIVISKK